MYRTISFIVIFSFVSFMLYFHNQNGHYRASDQGDIHGHKIINIPAGIQAPSLDGKVEQDPSGSWLLKIETENFTFAPEKGQENAYIELFKVEEHVQFFESITEFL